MNPERYLQALRPLAPLPSGLSPHGRLPEGIRCVLFDVYGTLLVSAAGDSGTPAALRKAEACIGKLLEEFQIPRSPAAVFDAYVAAIESRQTAMRRQGVDFPEVRIDKIWQTVLGTND
ncbi:MAG: hypothetical protein MUP74_01505, partial [Desulfobacterales bacterium]|nr:hypothetical protein [Desulfobacterales bacterium]